MAVTTAPKQKSGGRSSGIVYTAMGTVLVVLIAAITFTAAQTAPPAIAEIAPSAVEQIKDAPSEQSSELGNGAGGVGPGGDTTPTTTPGAGPSPTGGVTTTTEAVIQRGRVRRCIGSPPRQIEDPQSPPCVAYFDGPNGGATSHGVTGDTITVATPEIGGATVPLQNFFNKRFEFYGRKLVLKEIVTGGTCEAVKAGAAQVYNDYKAFGALSVLKMENCYMEELARLKLIGLSDDPVFSAPQLAAMHPYIWYYPTSFDDILTGLGQWVCSRFAGAPARFAEGVNAKTGLPMATSKRTFGLIVQPYATGHPFDTKPLDRALAGCGETLASTFTYPDDDLIGTKASRNAAINMQAAGVTSVLCMCGSFSNLFLPGAASSQSYYPEWMATSYNHNDNNINVKNYWPDGAERANLMVLTNRPRQWTYADTPFMWAIKEADPSFDNTSKYAALYDGQWRKLYRMLLVLASGIQLAGPNLTPATFAEGLQKAKFPNPATGLQAGRVGFTPGDHYSTDDFAESYWSEAANGPVDDGPGSICYIDGGARHAQGKWPKGDKPFFDLACDAGTQRAPNPIG